MFLIDKIYFKTYEIICYLGLNAFKLSVILMSLQDIILFQKGRKMYSIEKYDSKDGPRFRIMAKNGRIIAHSEAYINVASRARTIKVLKKDHNFQVKK